jgi:hypothetical protein
MSFSIKSIYSNYKDNLLVSFTGKYKKIYYDICIEKVSKYKYNKYIKFAHQSIIPIQFYEDSILKYYIIQIEINNNIQKKSFCIIEHSKKYKNNDFIEINSNNLDFNYYKYKIPIICWIVANGMILSHT